MRRACDDESGLEPGGVDLIEQARYSPSAPVWPSIVHSAPVALVTCARCGSSVFHHRSSTLRITITRARVTSLLRHVDDFLQD
jgi:hypothetical protein